ncbi:uncharacterized protein LOC115165034 [Salmo trutta]|uniref:uncharacterized protein LOC115165034 n=1 Tax=Salmo trutta TaxID=8032 RepID=UPI0011314B85|nr:uncharacterized protein LOC115165034 [Salmo trutta]
MPPKNRGRPGFDLTGNPTAPQSSASPEEEEPLDLSPKKIYCRNCGWRDSLRNSSFCVQCLVVLRDPVLNLSIDMKPNLSQTTAKPTWDIPPQLPSPDAIDLGISSFSFPPSLEASQSVFQTPEPDVVSLGPLLCRFCQETFALPILLHHHVKERHLHPCNMCCRIFKNDMLLIRHQVNMHSLVLPCRPRPAFSKRGPGRPKGVAHMLLKPYTRPKPTHVCQACSREFWSPGVLHKHKCNPRLVQCTTCGGYFGSHNLFCKHKSQNLCSNSWRAIGKAMAQAAYAAAQAAHRANSTNPQRERSGATFQILEINFTTPHHHSDSSLHSSNEEEELQSMDRSGAESPSA